MLRKNLVPTPNSATNFASNSTPTCDAFSLGSILPEQPNIPLYKNLRDSNC